VRENNIHIIRTVKTLELYSKTTTKLLFTWWWDRLYFKAN